MFCSNCGKQIGDADKFCSSCGAVHKTSATVSKSPDDTWIVPGSNPTGSPVPPPAYVAPVAKPSGQGLGIASLVIGVIGIVLGLVDYGGVTSGSYDYIYNSEIGLLFILSVLSVVFGSIANRRKAPIGRAALIVGLASLVITFMCARYAG